MQLIVICIEELDYIICCNQDLHCNALLFIVSSYKSLICDMNGASLIFALKNFFEHNYVAYIYISVA